MESNGGNKSLSKVYYVDVEAAGLMAVPAERLREVGQLRTEQDRRRAESQPFFAGLRMS